MPVVPVSFANQPRNRFVGLVDSGASATRVPYDFAKQFHVDLRDAPTEEFWAGGGRFLCHIARAEIQIGSMRARSLEVAFTKDWPFGHFLLGIRGFFENYVVTVNASKARVSVRPSREGPV